MSPACSSFDMFRDYEERAQRYIAAVEGLIIACSKNSTNTTW